MVDPQEIRRVILAESRRANVGHIGSALSIADLVAALYGVLRGVPGESDRDRFILSKGHAALALYAAIQARGWISAAELDTYCADGSQLGVHPERGLAGVDFSTGSLGHGLSLAVGASLAARLTGSSRRVFVLLSDAECNEGSLWEAVMFAAHHQLGNLIAVIDMNGQQALGYTNEVLSLEPLGERWRAFGWDTHDVDGHNLPALTQLLEGIDTHVGAPHVLVARTVFGRGVSYMQRQIRWHYLPMSEAEYQQAVTELAA